MARIDTLEHFLTDVASAIKTKKGDETDILASDFDTEITNLPSGGGNIAHPDYVSFRNYSGSTLDISWLRTDNMTDFAAMFYQSGHLTTIDVSNFDTSNATNMTSTFAECSVLSTITGLDRWDTSKVTSMFYMFGGNAIGLTTFNLSFNLENVTNMSQMFTNCGNLASFTFSSGLDTTNLRNIENMFSNCTALESIDLSNFNLQYVTSAGSLFNYCTSLETVTFGNYSMAITNLNSMFNHCTALENIYNFPEISASISLTSAQATFYGCSSLTNLDLSNIKSIKLRSMQNMFNSCTALETVDLRNINTDYSSSNASGMFLNCTSLQSIDLRSYDLNKIRTYTNMFGSSASDGPPDNCEIIVKDDTSKQWVTAYFPRLTNVKTVAEL